MKRHKIFLLSIVLSITGYQVVPVVMTKQVLEAFKYASKMDKTALYTNSNSFQVLTKELVKVQNSDGAIELNKKSLRVLLCALGERLHLTVPFMFVGNQQEGDKACCICLEEKSLPITLFCGHTACKQCLIQWYCTKNQNHTACPLCKELFGRYLIRWLRNDFRFRQCWIEGKISARKARLAQIDEDHEVAVRLQNDFELEFLAEDERTNDNESNHVHWNDGDADNSYDDEEIW